MTQASLNTSDWRGDNGTRWADNHARLEEMVAPFGEAALAAAQVRPGERVLDIGCGAGTTSVALARQVGADGEVLGVDISPTLLDLARREAIPNVGFTLADAADFAFQPAHYGLLFSRFGVMFFADPAAAFANMRSALRSGGRLAFVCWQSASVNDWNRLPMGAIAGIVPPQPPAGPEAPGPFSFGDPARIRRILGAAGFADIRIEPFARSILFGIGSSRDAAIDDAVDYARRVGPLSRALAGQSEAVIARATAAVRDAFAARAGPEGVTITGQAWIVTASA